jgi:hypothetical protein
MFACALATGSSPASETATEPAAPRGSLSVDRDLVRTGTRSQLNWKIEYPVSPVTDVIDFNGSDGCLAFPDGLTVKKNMKMRIRVLGASFQQAKSNNGHGNNIDGVDSSNPGGGNGGPNGEVDPSGTVDDEKKGTTMVDLPIELLWNLNSSPWTSLFYGYQNKIDPSKLALETTVKAGDRINLGGQGWINGAWLPFYSTATGSANAVMLKNGDRVPASVAALNIASIESFLKPYLDTSHKTVTIGNRDVIVLLELDQPNSSNTGFDLQDLVVLISFE